jgi:uncharacterized RDD family membrane protein YckC
MGATPAMPSRAGFWIRTAATIIDVVAMFMIAGSVGAGIVLAESSYAIHEGALVAIIYPAWLIYTFMEVCFAATPGKLLFRLRVRNSDGTPTDFWRLFLRWSTKWSWLFLSFLFLLTDWSPLYLLSGFISGVVFIGCFFAANDDHLTWHDQWALTSICHVPRRAGVPAGEVPPPPLPPLNPS